MSSSYPIPGIMRNLPCNPFTIGKEVVSPRFLNDALPRLAIRLLVLVILGVILIHSSEKNHTVPSSSLPDPTTDQTSDQTKPTLLPLSTATTAPPASPAPSGVTIIPMDPFLLPTLEALEGLFIPRGDSIDPLSQESDGNIRHTNALTDRRLTPLELHINETLLARIDPLLLGREQIELFARNIPTGYPMIFHSISSPFGFRVHPVLQETRFHPGIDFPAPMDTPVQATADGVVEYSGIDNGKMGMSGLGTVISLQHPYGFTTTYGHLSKSKVKAGDFVRKGDLIGWTGKSGMVTAPHLHYEIRFIHRYLNPMLFLEWTPASYERLFQEKGVQWLSLMEKFGNRNLQLPADTHPTQLPMIMARHWIRPQTPK